MRLILSLVLAAPLALLAACGDEPEPAADDARSATGEVVEGTISDAMLPLATVRSQPPLEDPEAATGEDEAQEPGPAAALQPFGSTATAAVTPAGSSSEPTAPASDEPAANEPATPEPEG